MFSERKMGTPARLMATKSVKSDQSTIKATRPQVAGWDFGHSPIKVASKFRH
jgi:hypothetical protein